MLGRKVPPPRRGSLVHVLQTAVKGLRVSQNNDNNNNNNNNNNNSKNGHHKWVKVGDQNVLVAWDAKAVHVSWHHPRMLHNNRPIPLVTWSLSGAKPRTADARVRRLPGYKSLVRKVLVAFKIALFESAIIVH